jgi:hypothetical protein
MRVVSTVPAAALLAAATAAWAQADQPASKPEVSPAAREATVSAKRDPDAVVCVSRQKMGSRIPGKKECHTLRVWDQMTDDARQAIERLQRTTMQHMQ